MKKEMKETDKFYRPVMLMEEQSVFLKEMLEDLSAIIRHKEIKRDNISINDAIRRAAKLLTDELRIRRIIWDLALAENLPLVNVDAIQLEQVFMNIMVNAMEAMAKQPLGETKSLKIKSQFDTAARQVLVSLEDSGPGIPQEALKEIFEPLYSTKDEGAGIGLSICKDIINTHGGEIAAESEKGKGAKFIIRLPVAA